jgi:hypothetical protein
MNKSNNLKGDTVTLRYTYKMLNHKTNRFDIKSRVVTLSKK